MKEIFLEIHVNTSLVQMLPEFLISETKVSMLQNARS